MNLHGIVAGAVASVNPTVTADLRVSTGNTIDANYVPVPGYATPGAITASLADNVLTVTVVAQGKLLVGQTVAGAGVPTGARIARQLTGDAGGPGTYELDRSAADPVTSEAMTTAMLIPAQVQALTFRDLQQIDGLNLNGERRAIYFYGRVDAIIRPDRKGGDLVILPDGSTWLVALVLEHWPDWTKVAVTRQNDS